jgi:hypothetical protein
MTTRRDYEPHWPEGNTTTSMGRSPFTDQPTNFWSLPAPLRGMQTHAIYLTPDGDVFNLAGPSKGREGVRACTQIFGDQQWNFEQVITNSPYMFGGEIERQNVPERRFNFSIIIGSHAPQLNEYQYRMAEKRWWRGQDETRDGWLGVYTRFSGWEWIPVRPDKGVTTPQSMDSTAYGNNASMWDITWVATRPYFTKPAAYRTFEAVNVDVPKPPPGSGIIGGIIDELLGDVYYWGTLPLANRGDLPSYATFYVSSPGQAIVQDNDSARLVPLPQTAKSVGTYMCDTEPGHRTLTAANDPQDNLLFDIIRQSKILNFFLSGVANEGLPLQLTWNNRFIYQIPPRTEVHLTVGHSEPNGVITAVVPSRFKRSR